MIRSRIARAIGFGLGFFAACVASFPSSLTLVLCEEPDGCVELEFVARGEDTSAGCGDHEHELHREAPGDAHQHAPEGDGEVGSCPCDDTILVAHADTVRPDKVRSAAPHAPIVADRAPRPLFFVHSHESVRLAAPRVRGPFPPPLRSVVLRI